MEVFISIMFFCLVTSITPGPNNIMLMTSGLNHGVMKSLPHLFGIVVGFPIMVAAIGLGLGIIFIKYPQIHLVIKILGMAYLLYLSFKVANAGNPQANDSIKKPFTFFQAAAFQWVNPKAWVIGIGAIATYTTQDNVLFDVVTILVGYLTMGTLSMLVWLVLGMLLQNLLTNKTHIKYFNWLMGGLLAASVFSMAINEVASV